ncbi:hypothetical protein KJ616_00985 [Patescibacteria group bacterium]|nr:hypothetical protein [Patescibacteria group bacterium]
MEKTRLQFIKLPVSVIKEGKKYVVFSSALDLSTSANNYERAKKRFEEIVDIFFEELIKNKTLDEVLLDLGWRRIAKKWSPPMIVSNDLQNICVSV